MESSPSHWVITTYKVFTYSFTLLARLWNIEDEALKYSNGGCNLVHPSSDIINIFWQNLLIINCRYGIHWWVLIIIIIMVVSGRVARFSFSELETELTFPWKLPINQKLEWLVERDTRRMTFKAVLFSTLWQEKGAVDPRGMFLGEKWHKVVIFWEKRRLKSPDLDHNL
jgi:hypothetical protein